jgi:uncharacterized protein YcgL (UPF0745 family)
MYKYVEKRKKYKQVMERGMGRNFGKIFPKLMLKLLLLVGLLELERLQLVELFQRL